MDRCPVCRARLGGKQSCRRCGCDLALAGACRHRAEGLLRQALQVLRRGETVRARSLADEAISLDSGAVVRKVAGFIRWWCDQNPRG